MNAEQLVRLTNILFITPFALKNIQSQTKHPYFKMGLTAAIIVGGLYTLDQYEKNKKLNNQPTV